MHAKGYNACSLHLQVSPVGDHLFPSSDIREKRTMKYRNKTWELAIKDPHLIRLGKYLAHSKGIQNPDNPLEDMLEKEYLQREEDSRNTTLIITKVVDMDMDMEVKAFIQVYTKQSELHSECPFVKFISSGKEKKNDTRRKTTGLPIPGLPDCVEETTYVKGNTFNLNWIQVKKERRGREASLFSWAVKPTQQHQPTVAIKTPKSPKCEWRQKPYCWILHLSPCCV
jgi:hypothetical protein